MSGATLSAAELPAAGASSRPDPVRLRRLVDEHYDFIWRSLRRLGVPEGDVDDAAQQVYLTTSSKLDQIDRGRERAFLFAVAVRTAGHARRSLQRRRETDDEPLQHQVLDVPAPDELTDQKRGRELLDAALDALPVELRSVIILFELEELSLSEIASLLEIPRGTVASRLRRGREELESIVARLTRKHGGAA